MQCWAPDKRDRPRFTDLVKFFDEHHRNVTRNRLQKPRHCDEKLYQTMMQCWAPDKRDRPRFTDLVKFFDEHHRNVTRNRSRIWSNKKNGYIQHAVPNTPAGMEMEPGDD